MRITPESLFTASWWPELLAVKDEHTWDFLGQRFGVPTNAIRRALELAGQPKKAMAPGRKPKGYQPPLIPTEPQVIEEPATSPLSRMHDRVGKMPDGELAELAGVPVEDVKMYRRDKGIAPFLRPPPGAPAPAPRLVPQPETHAINGSAESVVLRRRKTAEGGSTEVVHRTLAAVPAPVPRAAINPLDAYRDQMGQVADQVIAEQAGVDRGLVGRYRRQHGIPAWDGFRFRGREPGKPRTSELDRHAHLFGVHTDNDIADLTNVTLARVRAYRKRSGIAEVSPATPEEPKLKGRPGRRSVIAPFLELLGTVPDSDVAGKAGVAVGTVTEYRRRHGIAGFVPPAVPRTESETAKAPRTRRSKLDAHAALVGILPDAQLAVRAGVTAEAVRIYRRRHGIASPGRAREESVAQPEQDDVVNAALVPSTKAGKLHGYGVVAASAVDHRFIVLGTDISDALRRAVAVLDGRKDGPWTVKSIKVLAEALG